MAVLGVHRGNAKNIHGCLAGRIGRIACHNNIVCFHEFASFGREKERTIERIERELDNQIA